MKTNKKLTFVLALMIIAILTAAVVPVYAADKEEKTEAINEAKASFSDLYEKVNPSVVYIYVATPADDDDSMYQIFGYGDDDDYDYDYDYDEDYDYDYDYDYDDYNYFFGPQFEQFFRQYQQQQGRPNGRGNGDRNQPKNDDQEEEQNLTYGAGTGFVWDTEGHIVTNNHVVEDAVDITVTYSDGLVRKATVVGTDPDSDLAVILVEDPEDVTPVTMGDSDAMKPGDLVAAIGNPLSQTGTMTQGIISAVGRSYAVETGVDGSYTIPDVIQTDASINPGNSGGVLINLDGEVIGVPMAFSSYSYSSAGIGYAIPSNLVKQVVPALIENGEFEHPWLGMSGTSLTPDINEVLELPHDQRGALIQSVTEGGPSDKAGIKGGDEETELESGYTVMTGGDIVTKIGDRDVKGMDDIIAYLSSNTSIGETVTLHIIRDGKEMDVDVVLEARPTAAERKAAAEEKTEAQPQQEAGTAYLGAYIKDNGGDGVLIDSVNEDSPAEDAGLQSGDVILKIDNKDVSSAADLKAEISKHLPGERVDLTVERDGDTIDIRVALGNTLAR